MEKIPFTREGLEKVKQELERLEKTERPNNIKDIQEARSHGDISENAEYHAAKEKQSYLEARINELKDVISRSEVIEDHHYSDERVVFGRKVLLYNLQTEEEVTYQMVGPYESDPEQGKISVTSPLGRVLIGRTEGEEIKAKVPAGILEFEILEVL